MFFQSKKAQAIAGLIPDFKLSCTVLVAGAGLEPATFGL